MTNLQTTTSKILLVLGGTSDIGRATAAVFAAQGWRIQLAGRDVVALQREADDIAARTGGAVSVHRFDVLDTGAFASFVDGLPVLPDVVLCVVGVLGDQRRAETDLHHATLVMRSNYEGPSLILGVFAERFVARGSGTIIGVSSAAGDRGRGSNYVYGSAKAGFTTFLSGLRNRLSRTGVAVLTTKPGFVATRMTRGLNLQPALTAHPERIAEVIWTQYRNLTPIRYSDALWFMIMKTIYLIPESIFMKLKI